MSLGPPSEIDKAIALLSALKSARPKAFDEALALLMAAPGPDSEPSRSDSGQSASALALGLLQGSFSPQAAQMILDLAPQLPRLPSGAVAASSRPGSPPSSLASIAMRRGLERPWARFFAQAIRDGSLPCDPDCAADVASRLEDAFEDADDQTPWAGRPDLFHDALGALIDWPIDWAGARAQTGFDFVPWILERWLHEGGPDAYASATRACSRLFEANACGPLPAGAWLAFARPPKPELLAPSLVAMSQCLPLCSQALSDAGLTPCGLFCKLAYPCPSMGAALRECAKLDPQGPFAVAPDGSSCMSWINERLGQPGGALWRGPLLECFEILIELGADPRWIAPRVSPADLAKDPLVAAAIEAAEIAESSNCASPRPRDNL
jgi:hypothetical protein